MALAAAAEEYFRSMNSLAAKIHDDVIIAKKSYENIWETLTEKEKVEIINESIIKPDISLKHALVDNVDFEMNNPPAPAPVWRDLMAFFGHNHGQQPVVQDENISYRDEHSAPFLYQSKSQLNLCVLADCRGQIEEKPAPLMSELVISHSKVVSELKHALKSHEIRNSFKEEREVTSPGFISKIMGNFKGKDEERECLVSGHQIQVVASSDNFFRTNFKSPHVESNLEKEYRSSVAKFSSEPCEESRGLLASGPGGQVSDAPPAETPPPHKSGYDFLDNW